MTDNVTDTELDAADIGELDPVDGTDAESENESLDDAELRSVLEALLLVVDTPASLDALASATGEPTDRIAAVVRRRSGRDRPRN